MTQFEYLSVLVSIVIGLAITQLLSGAARLIQIRHRIRPHATTLLWMASLFLIDTQTWWAAFERRETRDWDFFLFLFYLLMPIVCFLLSFLVLPELGEEDDIDLAGSFARNQPWFFGLFVVLLCASLAEEYLRRHALPWNVDAGFRVLFIVLSLIALRIRSARFQFWNALFVLGLICSYIAILFPRLH